MTASPRRLLMVVHGPYPRSETRVEREARAARAHGWDVDVLAMREPDEQAEETGADGVRVFRLPLTRVRSSSPLHVAREYLGFTLLATLKTAKLHRRNHYTVVQIHNPPDFLVAAGVYPRLRGAKIVFDVHDFAPELFELRFAGRRGARTALAILGAVERLALRFADAVVTVHEPYRRGVIARGVPPAKITVALNSPDEQLLPPPGRTDGGAGFRVVYHGTITPHYGLETLVEAIALVRDDIPELVVEVYGGGDALDDVKARADELGVRALFRFSDGFLASRDVLQRVQGANVGVVANLPVERNKAALPTKLFEYTAMEIPVVSSDLEAVQEYFSGDEVRFFTAGDSTALAEAIRSVAADPGSAAQQAARARARYEEYRWSLSAERYAAMLESLATSER
jgi:glycosyltransferase involved in cell wall biosynthesis